MLIYVDIETTGVAQEDVVCAIAVIVEDKGSISVSGSLVNEGKKIPPAASALHNITDEDIKGQTSLTDSEAFLWLSRYPQATLICHDVAFTLEFLERSGWRHTGRFIDTKRVCRHLVDDLESYSLQYLRYEMRLYRKEAQMFQALGIAQKTRCAHDVFLDVTLTKLLFEELRLLESLERMYTLSTTPVLLKKFPFGKYTGRYIEEIASFDRGYLEWMLYNIDDLNEDLRFTLEYYL